MISVVESSALQLPPTSTLADQSRDFVAEERAHQRAHRLYNQQLEKQGFEVKKYEREIEKDLDALRAKLSLHAQLSLAAAFEHVTAVTSRIALRSGGLLSTSASPQHARGAGTAPKKWLISTSPPICSRRWVFPIGSGFSIFWPHRR